MNESGSLFKLLLKISVAYYYMSLTFCLLMRRWSFPLYIWTTFTICSNQRCNQNKVPTMFSRKQSTNRQCLTINQKQPCIMQRSSFNRSCEKEELNSLQYDTADYKISVDLPKFLQLVTRLGEERQCASSPALSSLSTLKNKSNITNTFQVTLLDTSEDKHTVTQCYCVQTLFTCLLVVTAVEFKVNSSGKAKTSRQRQISCCFFFYHTHLL